ncbi:MAG: TetR/AcrR family transcriptional regulator [Deltaproteobacteria bacterium]|jgi:AcrR family transcriptional regulator|nr:TetR/AcrR family transcriptional regulator [Deltaproteobacteria bacterium]MBW2531529.1 TetR/AcrR family transcriptional regulator [Deltaproteobacteria bacterium]
MDPQALPKARSGRDRSAEVLDAARGLFFERGYRGTTIQQIADRAGYSKRTVYLDYQNKDELFISVCVEGGQLLLEQLRQVPAAELGVEPCLDRFLDVYVRFSEEHREYFRMIFSDASPEVIANCSEQLRQQLASLEQECLGVLVRWCERAVGEGRIEPVDPWETAGILTGAATGIILLAMGGSQSVFTRQTRQTLARKAVTTIWRGLARASTAQEPRSEP